MTILWNIVALEANVETGAITTAHWEASDYEVVDGRTHRGRRYGPVNLEANVEIARCWHELAIFDIIKIIPDTINAYMEPVSHTPKLLIKKNSDGEINDVARTDLILN